MPRLPTPCFGKPVQKIAMSSASTELKLRLLAENLQKQIQQNTVFTEDYRVTKALGNFKVGDSVKGLDFDQIFIRLLGLKLPGDIDEPDTPEGPGVLPELPENPTNDQIIDSIVTQQTTIHQVTANGELEEIPYSVKTFTEQSYSLPPSTIETTFYKVLDDSGNTVEAGYQHMTELKEMYYMVALPSYMILGQNVKTQTWDDLSQCWVDAQTQLTRLPEDIGNAFESAGLATPTVPEGYILWADLNDIDAGTTYRFILI